MPQNFKVELSIQYRSVILMQKLKILNNKSECNEKDESNFLNFRKRYLLELILPKQM